VQAEDIRPVIVADRVEQAAGRQHVAQVQVGDEGFLALPHRPGEDLTAGRHDDRVAFLDPLAVVFAVLLRDEPVTVWEAGRNLADMQDRVDTDWSEETSDELLGSIGPSWGTRAYGGRSVRRLFLSSSAARARAA
jgi:hypothetical protein